MTECIQSDFKFEAAGRREIVARFDGGTIPRGSPKTGQLGSLQNRPVEAVI
jgi:hypothetical protein